MSDTGSRNCVLLPCSHTESWALPQQCLGEIVTVSAESGQPPAQITWRGEVIPVVDFGPDDPQPWRDERGGTGLVAVVLGLKGCSCPYWGLALRGHGLGVSAIGAEEIQDLPDEVLDHATAAFRMRGVVYQVPDLLALQQTIDPGGSSPRQ